MNKAEIIQVITILAGNYDSIANKDKRQKEIMIATWYECLKDLDYKLVEIAVKKTIIMSPYPPTIHEIRKNVAELMNPQSEKDNPLDAWEEASQMMSRGLYMSKEEFDKHSQIVKKFIGSLEQLRTYAMADADVINTVVKGQFMKQYEILKNREKEFNMLPADIKNITLKLSEKFDVNNLLKE